MSNKGVQARMASQMKAQKGRLDKFMESVVAVTGTEEENPEWLTQVMSQSARETATQVGKGLNSAIQPVMHQLSAQGAALKSMTMQFVEMLRSYVPGAAEKSQTGGQGADSQRQQEQDRLAKISAERDRQAAAEQSKTDAAGRKGDMARAGDAVKKGGALSKMIKSPKGKMAAKGAGLAAAAAILAVSVYKGLMKMSTQYVQERSFMGNYSAEVMSAQIGAQWGQRRRELAQSQVGGGDTAEVIKLLGGIQNELLPVKIAVNRMGASVSQRFLKYVETGAEKVGTFVEDMQLNSPFVSQEVKDDIKAVRKLMENAGAANETQMVLHEALLNHNQQQVRQPVKPVR